ncbi:MAG: LPS biosynthesis protein [Oceanospirillum sp.]|nr:LPS biosynthesis protein [Oceanospirillum sp.]
MRYCKSCLTTDLRPNADFDDDGVCIACRFSDSRTNFNADYRVLKKIIDGYLKDSDRYYDCIVGVSGGKDSTRQALWVRDKLKLNPLLVCCGYPPLQMSKLGADNLESLVKLDFDLVYACPAPDTAKELSKESFFKFGNILKATEIALFSTVPRLAIDMDIPLIFWGENPALQVGDSAAMGKDKFDGNQLRQLNTIASNGNAWMDPLFTSQANKYLYNYPNEQEFEDKSVQILYLGPAWDNWSVDNNSVFSVLNGLHVRPEQDNIGTSDVIGTSTLDEEFAHINMMLKYYKFGFGRATDLANELIRNKKITRDDAIDFVAKSDGVCSDRIIDSYCEYIGITLDEFWAEVNKITNPDIFEVCHGERPRPKFQIGVGLDERSCNY